MPQSVNGMNGTNGTQQHDTGEYVNLSSKFIENNADFKKQYCKMYSVRLEQMVPLLEERVRSKWGDQYPIAKVHKLERERKCVVIGTLFKDQKLKPSILKKLSEANSLVPQPVHTHFTDDSDSLFIEDELQRYQVVGQMDVHGLVTGVTCALLGTDQGKGQFMVEDVCFAECRAQVERPVPTRALYVCFVSGLELADYGRVEPQLHLLGLWAAGLLGGPGAAHLVVCGGSVQHGATAAASQDSGATAAAAVTALDTLLTRLASVLQVHVMPGAHDPTNHVMAQQPLHACVLPRSAHCSHVRRVPNPYEFEVAGTRLLGTAGQPVTDVLRYSRAPDPLAALQRCLVWGHLAPTAPDTLASYPYYGHDPFILEQCPHVMFAGNQPRFQTSVHEGPEGQRVRLLCVPRFSRGARLVQLDLRTLQCRCLRFRLDGPAGSGAAVAADDDDDAGDDRAEWVQ